MKAEHMKQAFKRFWDFRDVQVPEPDIPEEPTADDVERMLVEMSRHGEEIAPAIRNLRLSAGIDDDVIRVFRQGIEKYTRHLPRDEETINAAAFIGLVVGVTAEQLASES